MTVDYLSFIQPRLDEFLPTVRVGVDFGEHAGGIAVVRNNEILHAETFVDFHDTDLEMRRRLRRGRRTRHAKKMRLARLRSWVLRQRLPDGSRLPDPYWLLSEKNKQYWVQPGIYQNKGKDPRSAPSWIDLAKRGEVDAAGFVRAVTLIFKKRGYKYDEKSISEISDNDLKKFLVTARVPPEVSELHHGIEREIQRREENPDDPVRGRKKVPFAELKELFQQACDRLPQPRVAEHRSVKEADLRAVIDGYGKSAGLPPEAIAQWKRELIGEPALNGNRPHYGLLNKVLRAARFDNRIKSTCSWCEKKIPRKYKFREFAYKAVVNNLRARQGWRDRLLNEAEKNEFLTWWTDREKAPGLATIKKRLRLLNPRQGGMANQIYNLLKNDKPAGRVNLCQEHLEMAANGKTMKDAGLDWQTMRIRNAPNPKREDHDRRVLHRLEQILFVKGQYGAEAWRHGPVSLITLEVPEPQTERAKPGQVPERKEESFSERLLKELDGQCVYCGNTAVDKDHIFPHSRGGPDLWDNLVAACKSCNDAKDNRTPYQWFGNDAVKWAAFIKYVESLSVSPRKKTLLTNETPVFPGGDPTPLARVGSRPRQFVAELSRLFAQYGVPPPQLNYQVGRCHVQIVRGRLTWRLRHSWLARHDGVANFPQKDDFDLYNHAQDAAIVAACPPHTWRDQIFVFEAERPNFNGELVRRPGLAIPEIAPDWQGFISQRRHALVKVLGNYPVTWKSSFADETFGRNPEERNSGKLRISKLVKDFTVKDVERIVSSHWKDQLRSLAATLPSDQKRTFPDKIQQKFPDLRRLQLYRQPGGIAVTVKPSDGPARKIQVKLPSEGIILWRIGEKITLSLIRPRPLIQFGRQRNEPAVPDEAIVLARLKRHEILNLPETKKLSAGFYRITKFRDVGVTVIKENAMPKIIANRLELPATTAEHSKMSAPILLGKKDLAELFFREQPQNLPGS
jgi:hypothetical protein